MEQIEKAYYIKENQISISLMRFYVRIKICHNKEDLIFPLEVYSDSKLLLSFNFYNLEDAISFTQKVINKCRTKEEIGKKYKEMFINNEFALPKGMKKEEDNKIALIAEEVEQAIIEYFSSGKNYRISVQEELTIDNGNPHINFYLIEHLDYDGIKKDYKTCLTRGDLQNALSSYIEFYGYELIDFKYMGGVHHVGYYCDEDTPYYEGIELTVKEKKKDQVLVKNKREK